MRLIDANQITYSWQVDKHGKFHDGVTLQSVIDELPTIEAEPVKHGRWIKEPGAWHMHDTGEVVNILKCSCCGSYFKNAPYKYCPKCGAKMDLED